MELLQEADGCSVVVVVVARAEKAATAVECGWR
jgi:hypothetical protein